MDYDDFVPEPESGELKRLTDMANHLLNLRMQIAHLDAEIKQLASEERELSQVKLPEYMKELGLTEFTLTDGSKVMIQHKVKASITKARQQEAFKWLRENGHGALIKPKTVEEHVHHSTVAAFAREQLSLGKPLPDSFTVYEYDQTTIKTK